MLGSDNIQIRFFLISFLDSFSRRKCSAKHLAHQTLKIITSNQGLSKLTCYN